MQDFVFFLGRFHVLALHLPIGIVIAAVVLDWLARRPRYATLAQASPFLWGAAALSAVFTAACTSWTSARSIVSSSCTRTSPWRTSWLALN